MQTMRRSVHWGKRALRQFGVRLAEHRKEAEKTGNRNFTRSTSRSSANEYHKSAITDHVCQNNHAIDWEAGLKQV